LDEEQFGGGVKKKVFTENDKYGEKQNILIESSENMKKFLADCNVNIPEVLLKEESRYKCPGCGRMKKFYCPECLVAVSHNQLIPKVKLPLTLTIIHHESEKRGKSSALPLKIIGEPLVEVISFPNDELPAFDDEYTCVLYPHKNAKRIDELDVSVMQKLKKVVAVDCTWYQTNSILKQIDKPNTIYVKISDYETTFWRYQHHNKKCLATCEAIYYFYKEYDVHVNKTINSNPGYKYDGKYDDLLFYYVLQFNMIDEGMKMRGGYDEKEEDEDEKEKGISAVKNG